MLFQSWFTAVCKTAVTRINVETGPSDPIIQQLTRCVQPESPTAARFPTGSQYSDPSSGRLFRRLASHLAGGPSCTAHRRRNFRPSPPQYAGSFAPVPVARPGSQIDPTTAVDWEGRESWDGTGWLEPSQPRRQVGSRTWKRRCSRSCISTANNRSGSANRLVAPSTPCPLISSCDRLHIPSD